MPDKYQLYIYDISYFSGKVEAYLRYKQIDFERIEPTWNDMVDLVLPNTGLMKVPVIQTPDGKWLQDSTPIIEWFEKQHHQHAVLPEDEVVAFYCRLLEDYADEYLWRPALYYRWKFDLDAELYSHRFSEEFLSSLPFPREFTRWLSKERQRRIYIEGDGIDEDTCLHVESIYFSTLERLSAILEKQPFLLGDKPCMADFGFFASMFRHFSIDPTPGKIMRQHAPAVYEWVARLWNAKGEKLSKKKFKIKKGSIPEGWQELLADMGQAYMPYLHANALAYQAGRENFNVEIQGYLYQKLPVVKYRVWCRERLFQLYEGLSKPAREQVNNDFVSTQIDDLFWQYGQIESQMHEGVEPPFAKQADINPIDKMVYYLTGTHWKGAHE